MIRICHVQLLSILSGVQRAMLEILRHLDRRRYEPHVVCQQPGPLSDELRRLDIPCHFVPSLVRPIRPRHDLTAVRELTRLFREQQFRLVHTHSSKPGIVGRLAARRAQVPCVVHHVHAFAWHAFTPAPQRFAYAQIERWAGRYCDRVIFVNHEERLQAIRDGLLPEEKCLTIHNGVDLAPYSLTTHFASRQAFRQQHGLAEDELAILFCGRIDVPKQPLILPQIVAGLERRLPPHVKWRLLIAGSGPMQDQLDQAIAAANVAHRITQLGWQTEPHHAYHGSDLALQPSLWEGLPLSVVEAHAAGLPVVGSDVKGIREVITHATGYLCEPRQPAAYVAALAKLMLDVDERRAKSAAAHRRAHEHFDGDQNMRQVARCYDQWLNLAPHVLRHAA